MESLTGRRFGDWTVIEDTGSHKVLCKCSCEFKTERYVDRYTLLNGTSTECGHTRKKLDYDLTGQKFGEWEVIEYAGNQMWRCRCSCENHTERLINSRTLRRGMTHSCGYMKTSKFKKTMIERYGDTSPWKVGRTRSAEQLKALESRENFIEFIQTLGKSEKPTVSELSYALDIIECQVLIYIHKFKCEELVDISPNKSKIELDIIKFIRELNSDLTITTNRRDILKDCEIDIFIEELNIAIEVNGTYWHSSIIKNPLYHQNKTGKCIKNGIRLIHIFEYEWLNEEYSYKIRGYLKNIFSHNKVIYARNTEVVNIETKEYIAFTNEYHLQGSVNAPIILGLRAIESNELLGVMSFGKPRFGNNEDYEIYRLCWRSGVSVVGGAEKLFKGFIQRVKPKTVISYCDISKFDGNVYLRLGFKAVSLSKPGYVWVGGHNKSVLTRYQSQKDILISKGLGTPDQTEDEIMEGLGYFKIYNAGNIKFVWSSEDTLRMDASESTLGSDSN